MKGRRLVRKQHIQPVTYGIQFCKRFNASLVASGKFQLGVQQASLAEAVNVEHPQLCTDRTETFVHARHSNDRWIISTTDTECPCAISAVMILLTTRSLTFAKLPCKLLTILANIPWLLLCAGLTNMNHQGLSIILEPRVCSLCSSCSHGQQLHEFGHCSWHSCNRKSEESQSLQTMRTSPSFEPSDSCQIRHTIPYGASRRPQPSAARSTKNDNSCIGELPHGDVDGAYLLSRYEGIPCKDGEVKNITRVEPLLAVRDFMKITANTRF